MSPIQVVFFDAAGTLFHVKGSVEEVYLHYAQRYGVPRTPERLGAVRAAFRRAFQEAPAPVFAAREPAEIVRCERMWWFDIVHSVFYRVGMFEGFDEYFEEVFDAFSGPTHWGLYPETVNVLTHLKAEGVELGIISNFDTRLFSVLRGLGIADFFATVTLSSLTHAAKPAPKIFQEALAKHAVEPGEAMHVGNSLKEDVAGALHAGLRSVWVDRGNGTEAEGPPGDSNVAVLPTLDPLPQLIRKS